MTAPRILPAGVVLEPLLSPGEAEPPTLPPHPRKARKSQRRDPGGRFGVANWFADNAMAELPRGAIAVWWVLWRDTQPNGTASASVSWLAERAGCNRATVIRSIRLLTDKGLVEIVRRGGVGRGASRYRVRGGT